MAAIWIHRRQHLGSAPSTVAVVSGAPTVTIDGTRPGGPRDGVSASVASDPDTLVPLRRTRQQWRAGRDRRAQGCRHQPALDGGADALAPATDARGPRTCRRRQRPPQRRQYFRSRAFELQPPAAEPRRHDRGRTWSTIRRLTSLREALAFANSHTGPDVITFAASLAGQTLTLTQASSRSPRPSRSTATRSATTPRRHHLSMRTMPRACSTSRAPPRPSTAGGSRGACQRHQCRWGREAQCVPQYESGNVGGAGGGSSE